MAYTPGRTGHPEHRPALPVAAPVVAWCLCLRPGKMRDVTVTTGDLEQLVRRVQSRVDAVAQLRFPLPVTGAGSAAATRDALTNQLDDYILPRLRNLDAPMLAVLGGSTGTGKSTLLNALLRRQVATTGVLRPTTRHPVLVHRPDEATWLTESGDLAEVVQCVPDDAVPSGLALLDTPDVDSVVVDNRELADRLLAAADLWIYVTSAARYADAVPWELLNAASERHAAVAIVLARTPREHITEVGSDLATMLTTQGLTDAPFFVIPETAFDDDGLLPERDVRPLLRWLQGLSDDAITRHSLVRGTLDGALDAVVHAVPSLDEATAAQADASARLHKTVRDAYEAADQQVDTALRDGAVLRGEALARWQDFIGTGAMFRTVGHRVGRARDQVTALLRGRPQPASDVERAIGDGLHALLVDVAESAADAVATGWGSVPAAAGLDADSPCPSSDLDDRAGVLVREWQTGVLNLVRDHGSDGRLNARALSLGDNSVSVALMVMVCAPASVASGQQVLEAVVGEQTASRMAATARDDLRRRAGALFAHEAAQFDAALQCVAIDDQTRSRLRTATEEIQHVPTSRSSAR